MTGATTTTGSTTIIHLKTKLLTQKEATATTAQPYLVTHPQQAAAQSPHPSTQKGEAADLVIALIVLAILGGAFYLLHHHKRLFP